MRVGFLKLAALGAPCFVIVVALCAVLAGQELYTARTAAIKDAQSRQQLANSQQRPAFGVAAMSKYTNWQPRLKIYRPVKPVPSTPKAAKATVVHRIPTAEPVIFITIDDGVTPDYAGLELMRQRGAVASLFVNDANIHRHYDYFKYWRKAGSTIQNHTVNHPHLPRLPLAAQKQEICDNAKRLTHIFGTAPTILRPPYGESNDATRQAAAECDEKIIANWSVVVEKGQLHYQNVDRLRPGDIVLLHFTPELKQDLSALFAAADAQGLQIGRLEDWLY